MQIKNADLIHVKEWQESLIPKECGDLAFALTVGDAKNVALADACGHGPAAARMASSFRELATADFHRAISASVFCRWNRQLAEELPDTAFVAATIVEPRSEDGSVCVWNAGNPAPLWIRRSAGRVVKLREYGLPLGIVLAESYEPPKPCKIHPRPGDALLVFTDGLIDQMSRRVRFGERQVCESIVDAMKREVDPLETLKESMTEFLGQGSINDDLTALWLTWDAEPSQLQTDAIWDAA